MEGHWYDRTQEYAARRRNETVDPMQFATLVALELSPLPCWKHLPVETQRKLVAEMAADIEQEAAANTLILWDQESHAPGHLHSADLNIAAPET